MTITWESLQQFSVHLQTPTLPPPYRYEIQAHLERHSTGWGVSFSLQYLDRDNLTEEELMEEGFSEDDDFSWQGALPEAWELHFAEALGVTTFPKNQKEAAKTQPHVVLKAIPAEGEATEGIPAETGYWEYLLQELMQAIYELAGLERPLEMAYREVSKQEPPVQIDLQASFARRSAQVHVTQGDGEPQPPQTISWKQVKEGMRRMYQYEYDVLRAKPKLPQKRGVYLFLGDGGWLPLPEALIPEGKETPTAEHIRTWWRQWMAD